MRRARKRPRLKRRTPDASGRIHAAAYRPRTSRHACGRQSQQDHTALPRRDRHTLICGREDAKTHSQHERFLCARVHLFRAAHRARSSELLLSICVDRSLTLSFSCFLFCRRAQKITTQKRVLQHRYQQRNSNNFLLFHKRAHGGDRGRRHVLCL